MKQDETNNKKKNELKLVSLYSIRTKAYTYEENIPLPILLFVGSIIYYL